MRKRFAPRLMATWLAGVWFALCGPAFGETAVQLGVVYNDYSDDVRAANADRINSRFANLATNDTTSEGLVFAKGAVFIDETAVVLGGRGGVITGGGCSNWAFGENDADDAAVTRIVGSGLEKVLSIESHRLRIDNVEIWGYSNATTAGLLAADPAGYADIGVFIPENPGNQDTGKLTSSMLAVKGCKVGIEMGQNFTGNHADQLEIDLLIGSYISDALVRMNNEQSLGHRFDAVRCYNVRTMFDCSANGGNFTCQYAYMGSGTLNVNDQGTPLDPEDDTTEATLLKVGPQGINLNGFVFGMVAPDNSLSDFTLFEASQSSPANLHVGYLQVGNLTQVHATLHGANRVVINGGYGMKDNVITYTEAGGSRPIWIMRNVVMKSGENVLDMVAGGTGTMYVVIEHELPGSAETKVIYQTWVNGVLESQKENVRVNSYGAIFLPGAAAISGSSAFSPVNISTNTDGTNPIVTLGGPNAEGVSLRQHAAVAWTNSVSTSAFANRDTFLRREAANSVGVASAQSGGTRGSLLVGDDAYGAGWDGSSAVPTKNAVYDKLQRTGSIIYGQIASLSPNDNTIYHGGLPSTPMSTAAENRARGVTFPRSGTIRAANIYMTPFGGAGSSETFAIYLRKNATQDYPLTEVAQLDQAGGELFSAPDMDIPISAGDTIYMKWVTPNPGWATNPLNVFGTWTMEFIPD